MIWKRKRRAQAEETMAAFEEKTANLIQAYNEGDWDTVLREARWVEELLKPLFDIIRMEVCLYHAQSLQLRIAYKRKDVELIREVAGHSGREISEKAFRTLQRIAVHSGGTDSSAMSLDEILQEAEKELRMISDSESQIVNMRNPHPGLRNVRIFYNLYDPEGRH